MLHCNDRATKEKFITIKLKNGIPLYCLAWYTSQRMGYNWKERETFRTTASMAMLASDREIDKVHGF